jgi:secreted PhoX family phosphatase
MPTRRQFNKGLVGAAFAGLSSSLLGCSQSETKTMITPTTAGYGPLLPDPNGLLDLPEGFSYKVISSLDNLMSDGLTVPNKADGMGCFKWDDDRVVLVRNHELKPGDIKKSTPQLAEFKSELTYDSFNDDVAVPGGTTNIIYNLKTGKVEKEFLSLVGTIRNCSGGITPWQTWLSCEESVDRAGDKLKQDHGYVFEVPAAAEGLIEAKPLKDMGRFNHEAACVDPRTGIVYMTEDRGDSLFYRFIPNVPGELEKGGQLQAMAIQHIAKFDSRNWNNQTMPLNKWYQVEWFDLEDPESPNDDLRIRGYEAGGALFARGEGIHWADNELYFCCTNGGAKQLGQIMRYQPSNFEGKTNEKSSPGQIQLFLESTDESLYNFGDNLVVAPNGHLIVCEDQYTDTTMNHLRGVTPKGEVYGFAKVRIQTEPAGACFSPDGNVMFVNLYAPTRTLAITGPFSTVLG